MALIEDLLAGAREWHRVTGRPLVTLTYAQSLDGSIAAQRGKPLRLSGAASMRMTHELRAAHKAILVGIGTVLADKPRLTARGVKGDHPQPVVLDSQLRTPTDAPLFDKEPRPWVFGVEPVDGKAAEALEKSGAKVFPVAREADGGLSLAAVLDRLGEEGIHSLMVEGGAQVIGSFLKSNLADQVVLTVAPIFVGGLRAVESLIGNGVGFPRLEEVQLELLGEDLVIWGRMEGKRKGAELNAPSLEGNANTRRR